MLASTIYVGRVDPAWAYIVACACLGIGWALSRAVAEIDRERKRDAQESLEAEEARVIRAVESGETDALMAEGISPVEDQTGEEQWAFPTPRRPFNRTEFYDQVLTRGQSLGLAVFLGGSAGAIVGVLVAGLLALIALIFGVELRTPR